MSAPSPIAERAAAPETLPAITAGGLAWGPATPEDAASLTALTNSVAEADGAPMRVTLEETQDELAAPGVDLERDTLLGRDDAGVVCAFGSVMAPPGDESTVRAFLFGGVHPQWRGRGIGSELVAWQVARARQVLAGSGKDLPGRIAAFAEDTDPPERHELFRRAGFGPRRFYADLRRPLTGDGPAIPEVDLAPPLRLVPFSAELDEATRLAHNDAFRDHWGSEPQTPEQWVNGRSEFAPEWSFVVVDDSAAADGEPFVVAYALSGRYAADFPVRGYTFGYTDVLGTRRGYRGRKAAVAALAASMRAFADAGMEAAVLDVDTENPSGAHGLYASLGYTKEHGSVMYSIEL